ncbi:MAG: AraC family transcriptional regulator [Rhodobacteraceae bacterium]|nr:AraC family transcriptional regulator [Paracoccaceae bacterium]
MPASYEDRILRVLSYIHDNPNGDMSLDRLADVAAMSRFHWHRVFRAMTGETCAQAVRRVRMHHAAVLLVQSELEIEQIALECGYPNAVSFARTFQDAYAQRPLAFRKSGRLMPPRSPNHPGKTKMYPVEIRIEPPRKIAAVPHKGSYSMMGKSFEQFATMCESRGLWSNMGQMLAIYPDDPDVTPEKDLISFAGAEWSGDEIPEGLHEKVLKGGKTAVLTYKGAYPRISDAYQYLFGDWLPNSQEEPEDGPRFEIHLNSPRQVAPDALLSEIYLPLK